MATIQEARFMVNQQMPYYRHLLWRMPVIMTTDIPTMGVDQWAKLYVNPDFLAALPVNQAAAILVHEIEHVICRHVARRGSRDADRWNIAIDVIVNERIKSYASGGGSRRLEIPSSGKFKGYFCADVPGSNPNMLPEDVYPLVPQRPTCAAGFGGSCSDGVPRPWEQPEGGLSDTDQQIISKGVASAIAGGDGIGKLPGSLKMELGVALPTESLEERVLRRLKTWGGAIPVGDHSTYQRMPRRPLPGFMTPGRFGVKPRLMVAWDTSGSMMERDHSLGQAVVKELLHRFREVLVLAGDTHVQSAKKVFKETDIDLRGGGGTDMSEMIRQAHEMDKKAAILVVTDGLTGWPQAKLPVPVFALLTRPSSMVPKWMGTCDLF